MKKYNAIIIGSGRGGKILAQNMAERNLKVAIIERDETIFGGTCLNVGCIPTKFLILQSLKNKNIEDFEASKSLYDNTITNKDSMISMFRNKVQGMMGQHENIDIYIGEGSFVNNKTISVKTKENTIELEGERIFINTGAETFYPNIKGLKESKYVYDSRKIMELKELPKTLIVIGAGYIGVEFAEMYRNFGSEVVVLEAMDKFLPREDEEMAEVIKQSLIKKGIKLEFGAKVNEINENKVSYEQNGEVKTIEANAILVAIGRKPSTSNLKLENTGIELNEKGGIITNDSLETTVPNIWAMGDVRGKLQFTYISADDYRIIENQIFGDKTYDLSKRTVVPYTMFTTPQFSRVGMTEKEAIEKGYEIKVAKFMPMHPVMMISNETDGMLKAVVDAKTDKILGASLFMGRSTELINLIALAMRLDASYKVIRNGVFTHPSAVEMLNDLFETIGS